MVRILWGDDNRDYMISLVDFLKDPGSIDCETFETGEALVERARTDGYDAVITDLDYGSGINGIEVVRQIREFNPNVSIYLLTGEWNAKERFRDTPGLTKIIMKGRNTDQELIKLLKPQP